MSMISVLLAIIRNSSVVCSDLRVQKYKLISNGPNVFEESLKVFFQPLKITPHHIQSLLLRFPLLSFGVAKIKTNS